MAILLVDKPKGISSYDVIRILQRRCRTLGIVQKKEHKLHPQPPKMGHGGTLDPLASGLMIIATGKDTKQLATLLGLPKSYTAEIILGQKTTTADLEGDVIEEKPVPPLSEHIIQEVLTSMNGDIELAVPIYSAIKKDGKSLYEYARKGREIDVPTKIMHIEQAELLSIDTTDSANPVITIHFYVKSGTYIRSLAEEFAQRLGTVGVLKELRRTTIGEFSVESAKLPEEIDISHIQDVVTKEK